MSEISVMKKLIILVLALLCVFGLFGCNNQNKNDIEVNASVEMSESDMVLEEPPALIVINNESSIEACMGTYSWAYNKKDGTSSDICSDSGHPLMSKEYMSAIALSEPLCAHLQFGASGNKVIPEEIMVFCWSSEEWENISANSEIIEADNDNGDWFFTLKDGNYVYQVVAAFSQDGEDGRYIGRVSYCFYTAEPTKE